MLANSFALHIPFKAKVLHVRAPSALRASVTFKSYEKVDILSITRAPREKQHVVARESNTLTSLKVATLRERIPRREMPT